MDEGKKITRRGFVMTGGGAKGLYEAGVIHAFHICGMNFDVITGSSIGAMNSIFYAEYLYRKNNLPDLVREDPERTIEALDDLVRAYLHAWWQMPERGIIDDSDAGPLGKLKDDLEKFDLNLPEVVRLLWWSSDPARGKIPPPSIWPAVSRLLRELAERVGGMGELLRIFKDHRDTMIQESTRTYLTRFGMENSLVPAGSDQMLTSFFTDPITPITAIQAAGERGTPLGMGSPIRIVEEGRTLRDYYEAGVDVRLTRVNYRTGRLEISAYLSDQNFVAYLEKQSKRTREESIEAMPIGSFRLQIPGNPNAVNSALASGRFPGVFKPYPITAIYPLERPENGLLSLMLEGWMHNPETEKVMFQAYQSLHPEERDLGKKWEELFSRWKDSEMMREFFPNHEDIYVDGGAIDNTPSNSAIDSVREWAERQGRSRGEVELDLYEVLLHPEPAVSTQKAENPAFYDVVMRTLNIQGAAKLSADAVAVENINTFGKRGHAAAQSLLSMTRAVRSLYDTADEGQKAVLEECLYREAAARLDEEYLGESSTGILDRIEDWAARMIDRRLPLQVNLIRIYPDEMTLDTLQFTQRLGYRLKNAMDTTTMGCYNAMFALRKHLEARQREYTQRGQELNENDRNALRLARKWMNLETWPESSAEQERIEMGWKCARSECVFHERLCKHGGAAGR